MSTPQPVRFAILGYGLHANRRMVPAFAGSKDTVLAGIWRRNQQAAAETCRQQNIPLNFPTREALCSSPEIDAVFIASPDAMHFDDALLAIRHGKAVLCEKPVAMDAAQACKMAAAAAAAGVLYGVAQNFRFNLSVQLFRDWIAAGKIGTPLLAALQFCYPAQNSPRKWIADPGVACGGPIGDVGIHCIDTLRYILAAEVLSVSTLATTAEPPASAAPVPIDPGAPALAVPDRPAPQPGARKIETSASLQLEMSKNIAAHVTVTGRAPYRTLIEVTGSDGVLVAENGLTVDRPVEVQLRRAGELVESVPIDNAAAYSIMLDSFAASLRTGAPFSATGADAIHNMNAIDAAFRSWRSGQREPAI